MFLLDYKISPRKEFPPHILRMAKTAKQKSWIYPKTKVEQNQRQIVQPAYLKLKRKPGAPQGNRNAHKHGLYAGGLLELKRKARIAIASVKLSAAIANQQAAMMRADTALRLHAARLDRRAVRL